jgi:hypothetical protein
MMESDEFGRDPAVQMMRRVFRRMEAVQEQLIERSGLSPFDERLRGVRESALRAFEQAWAAKGRSVSLTENDYADVYETCLMEILGRKDRAQ